MRKLSFATSFVYSLKWRKFATFSAFFIIRIFSYVLKVKLTIKQKDTRTGITYVYESISAWDKEKKQSRSKRKLLGRFDEETGEIIPTDGRCKKRSPYYDPDADLAEKAPRTLAEYKEAYKKLLKENEMLKKEISDLKSTK